MGRRFDRLQAVFEDRQPESPAAALRHVKSAKYFIDQGAGAIFVDMREIKSSEDANATVDRILKRTAARSRLT
ncbi:hypothetical protein AB4Y72_16515 [Arthrobacter sp. YAF34]|uniref:hypothetical protein n=1 Tax=Arthrobacter sp. YAF34 TaxID=3233083 RepID=UPI003F90AD67